MDFCGYLYNGILEAYITLANNYKRHIHILNHILDLAWPKYMKLTLEKQYMFVCPKQSMSCLLMFCRL